MKYCAEGCRPVCVKCGRTKTPIGRSAAPEAANGLCDFECEGYYESPSACDLWPGEKRDEN